MIVQNLCFAVYPRDLPCSSSYLLHVTVLALNMKWESLLKSLQEVRKNVLIVFVFLMQVVNVSKITELAHDVSIAVDFAPL